MKQLAIASLAVLLALAAAAEPPVRVSVLENAILCVRASRVPGNVTDDIRAASVPKSLSGTILDLRFSDDAATNAADYFLSQRSPLVILVNRQTFGPAAALVRQLRVSADAIVIGSGNCDDFSPDIVVNVNLDEERKFQEDPFLQPALGATNSLSNTNLIGFVDHTSEAELVRKRIKDGDDDGSSLAPRAEPPQPIVRDPALARGMDILKALAVLHPARG